MKKIMTMILAVLLLTGCVGSVGDANMQKDGSGACTVSVGYTEEVIGLINEIAAENGGETVDLSALESFSRDGVTFYGNVLEFSFEDPAELADTLNALQGHEDNTVELGTFSFEDDGDALTLNIRTTENTGAVGSEDEAYAELVADARVVYTFRFFGDVAQTAGRELDAFEVGGNTLTVDYVKISEAAVGEETFSFTVNGAEIPTWKSVSFPDVKVGDWFYDNVISMANAGLIQGRASGKFCPQHLMTKAEFGAVAVRALIGEAQENLLVGKKSPWWDKYYTAAVEGELLDPELFPYEGMDMSMTREEMAQIAYALIRANYADNAFDFEETVASVPDFAQVSEDFSEAVAYCYSDGILKGRDDSGAFYPKAYMTRAEASAVMNRVLERISDANEETFG